MEELTKIGFFRAGEWKNNEGNDKYSDSLKGEILDQNKFLYAFVINNKIKYIGKSDRSPRQRLRNGWARNKSKIIIEKSTTGGKNLANSINSGEKVLIFIWFPEIEIGSVKIQAIGISQSDLINSAKDGVLRKIESHLIRKFKPEWNGNS